MTDLGFHVDSDSIKRVFRSSVAHLLPIGAIEVATNVIPPSSSSSCSCSAPGGDNDDGEHVNCVDCRSVDLLKVQMATVDHD